MRLAVRGQYPADWREIARRVKDEAGWRCIRCGHPFSPHGSPLLCDPECEARERCQRLRAGKTLNFGVHHLDGDKANCRWWNLLALCNSCHLSVQARVIPERPWLLDHSLWFQPFVAGFYAHYYGGLDLSRADVEADIDRYLAMGQPWRAEKSA